jgi:hypothetical protein
MGPNTKVSGISIPMSAMEEVFRFGLMVVFMKDIGEEIKLMVEEDSYMLMVMSMRVIG